LATSLLKPGQQLRATHFFTTAIRDNHHNAADRLRQVDYIQALASRGVAVQYGHYLEKTRTCNRCHASWVDYEEKMTDVNLAVQLLMDAFDNAFDVALVISGDSDLTTPIKCVRQRFPHKRLIVAFPPKRHSAALRSAAHGCLTIGEDKLRDSQLPERILKPNGHVLLRPESWK
jgi:uncharacterized LabA/DUF88 family protein